MAVSITVSIFSHFLVGIQFSLNNYAYFVVKIYGCRFTFLLVRWPSRGVIQGDKNFVSVIPVSSSYLYSSSLILALMVAFDAVVINFYYPKILSASKRQFLKRKEEVIERCL